MIPVYQTKTINPHGETNWRAACYASILERTIADVAPLVAATLLNPADQAVVLAAQGYKVKRSTMDEGAPSGYAILKGLGYETYPDNHPLAGQPIPHGIILYNGQTLHDPFPNRSGFSIMEYTGYEQILPLTAS